VITTRTAGEHAAPSVHTGRSVNIAVLFTSVGNWWPASVTLFVYKITAKQNRNVEVNRLQRTDDSSMIAHICALCAISAQNHHNWKEHAENQHRVATSSECRYTLRRPSLVVSAVYPGGDV